MAKSFPPILNVLNVTEKVRGSYDALKGEAHQYMVAGILMRLGFLVSVITVRAGTYDVIVPAYEDFSNLKEPNKLLRIQVKTIGSNSLRLTAGIRAGADRFYRSDVKAYKYDTKHHDLMIGVDLTTIDLYFVPTRFIDRWGKSVTIRKLQPLKNNYQILLNWNEQYLTNLSNQLIS